MTAASNQPAAPAAPDVLLWGTPAMVGTTPSAWIPGRWSQVLGLLALQSGQWVPRDRIAALLWPRLEAGEARRNLRNVLLKARPLPAGLTIQRNAHALRWDVSTDLQAFDAAIAGGQFILALDWRRGRLLEGMETASLDADAGWLDAERDRLDGRWRDTALLALGQPMAPAARAQLAGRLLQLDPLDEEALAALLEAEHARGHMAQARRHYRAFAARMQHELGVEPSSHLRVLAEAVPPAWVSAALARPPVADTAAVQLDRRFVGRRVDLAALDAALTDSSRRLLTLLGPGGVGKSSLAQQFAGRIASRFAGGVFWIELHDLADPVAAAARLALRLQLTLDESQDAAGQIGAALSAAPSLLVFDNAEHLPTLADFIDRLLGRAPLLWAIVTSRVRLASPQEQVRLVQGLAVPDEDSRDLEAAQTFDAVRLFAARAGAVRRGFQLARHLAAVIDCVEAVQGLPLAIELTAAWVRLLPPEHIAHELRSSIDLLERDPLQPGVPARPDHLSMRRVLEATWQQLSVAERKGLAALSVFQGGFAAAAARAVAEVPMSLLATLVDKSLVQVDDSARFGLHPLVQAHAAAQLHADPGPATAAAQRHADYFAQQTATLERQHAASPALLAAAMDPELSNILAAWQTAVAQPLPDQVAALAPALRTLFHVRGRLADGVARLRPALALPQRGLASIAALAHVQQAIAALHYQRFDLDEAARLGTAALTGARRCRDRRLQFRCLSTLGACHSSAGRWLDARRLFERALAIARADGERAEIARAMADLGIIAKKQGAFDLALKHYTQALTINRELGIQDAAGRCLNNIGVLWMERNDWQRAREVMADGAAHCERHGLDSLRPYLQNGLGLALYELGEIDAAERQLEVAMQCIRKTEARGIELQCAMFLARVANRRGRHADALLQLRAVASAARQQGVPDTLFDIALYLGECQRDSGHRLDAARTWGLLGRHPGVQAGVRASATRWRDALALDVAERQQCDAAALSLDQVIDQLLATRP